MRFMTAMKKPLLASVAAASLLTSGMVTAEVVDEKPSAGAMVVDAVFVRPLYFLLSQAGSVVYGATLPFTLLGENATDAAETLVVTPLQGTFVRCLGCNDIENQVSSLEEGEGKSIRHFVMATAGQTINLDDDDEIYGIYLGTNFSLTDSSRYDVLVGAKSLLSDSNSTKSESLVSYEIVSRFGKELFNDFDILFKLGIHQWRYNFNDKTPRNEDIKDKRYSFLYGGGVSYNITNDVRVGLDYTRYDIELDEDSTKIETADLNISYMF